MSIFGRNFGAGKHTVVVYILPKRSSLRLKCEDSMIHQKKSVRCCRFLEEYTAFGPLEMKTQSKKKSPRFDPKKNPRALRSHHGTVSLLGTGRRWIWKKRRLVCFFFHWTKIGTDIFSQTLHYYPLFTPWKINMESEHHPIAKENHLPNSKP